MKAIFNKLANSNLQIKEVINLNVYSLEEAKQMDLNYPLTNLTGDVQHVCILPIEVIKKLKNARILIKEATNILENTKPFSLNK